MIFIQSSLEYPNACVLDYVCISFKYKLIILVIVYFLDHILQIYLYGSLPKQKMKSYIEWCGICLGMCIGFYQFDSEILV